MPRFSVVIPTFNRAEEVNRAIRSALLQTITDLEILVMDDGSTDNTREVVAGFNDPRIIYEWEPHSGVPPVPRNRGISKAQGEWICFLDSDDWWMPNKLEVCLEHINENVDLICHDLEIIRDKPALFGRKRPKGRRLTVPVLIHLLVNGNAISHSSVVVRKSLLDQVGGMDENPEIVGVEDYSTWLRIAQVTDGFVYIPKRLGFYLVHDKGISRKDLSGPGRCASAAFIHVLNESQRNRHEAYFSYMSGKFDYCNELYESARSKLLFSLRHGNAEMRVKSLYMLGVGCLVFLRRPR